MYRYWINDDYKVACVNCCWIAVGSCKREPTLEFERPDDLVSAFAAMGAPGFWGFTASLGLGGWTDSEASSFDLLILPGLLMLLADFL